MRRAQRSDFPTARDRILRALEDALLRRQPHRVKDAWCAVESVLPVGDLKIAAADDILMNKSMRGDFFSVHKYRLSRGKRLDEVGTLQAVEARVARCTSAMLRSKDTRRIFSDKDGKRPERHHFAATVNPLESRHLGDDPR